MKDKRFVLEKHCFLVKGAKRGAIYNLKDGQVYSVDEHVVNLINGCEKGLLIGQVLKDYSTDLHTKAFDCIKELINLKIGHFLKDGEKINKIKINKPKPLSFIWLEVTTRCNLRCQHCYIGNKNTLVAERMDKKDWIKIMREAYIIGCRKLQFIGGEPFLIGKKLFDLIIKAKEIGYQMVEVYTNATLLDNEKIDFLANNKVNIAVSVYGSNSKIHDEITRIQGSFDKTISNLTKMLKNGVKIRVGVIAMSINQDDIDATIDFLRNDIGINEVGIDIIRPCGNGNNINLVPRKLIARTKISKPEFLNCDFKTFQRAKYGHNCFSTKICVTADGSVLPCIMARDLVLGNVLKNSLKDILQNKKAKEIRGLSKDKIEVCKDCEYRYCCFDCRPKAQASSIDNNLYAKPAECLYNPYSGKWGKEGDEKNV